MNQKCQNCPKSGAHCDGLRFLRSSSQEVLDWCKAKAKAKGWSYERVAREADVSVGTVSNYFSGKHQGCNYDTLSHFVQVLADDLEESECPSTLRDTIDQQGATISEQQEIIARQEDTLRALEQENTEFKARIAKLEQMHQDIFEEQRAADQKLFEERRAGDRKTLRTLRRLLLLFIVLFSISFLVIATGLIVDFLNGDVGFFWLDHMKEFFDTGAVRLFHGLI